MYLFIGGMPASRVDVWEIHSETLRVAKVHTQEGLFSPSFLCTHPTQNLLYAAERRVNQKDASSGAITTFRIAADGSLTTLGRSLSAGAFTAHVAVSSSGRYLTTANPLGPTAACFLLNSEGLPSNTLDVEHFSGRGALERQSAPWPHSAYISDDEQRMFVCDMGLDKIFIYDIDNSPRLVPAPQPFAQVSSGAGARHMAIHPGGDYLYVANELDSSISVFHYDAANCRISIRQTIQSVPVDFTGENQPAEILTSPDGRFVYITNRGHESIGVFTVDPENGSLSEVDYVNCQGQGPRHMAISADGRLAAVSNQKSNKVVLFNVNRETGYLAPVGCGLDFENPTCAVFT